MTTPEIALNDTQKAYVMTNYARESIVTMARKLFGDPLLDARSDEARAIKKYLSGEKVPVAKVVSAPRPVLTLTSDQKKLIEDMSHKMKSLELTRHVFDDPAIKNMAPEHQLVYKHWKTCFPEGVDASDEPVEEVEYHPPVNIAKLVDLVNEYVPTGEVSKKLYLVPLKLTDERNLKALMSYLRIIRFKIQAGQYQRNIDRQLFISTFMRFTHDKPDLTAEEQDQYIAAAAETVNIARIERDLMKIEGHIDEIMSGDREARGQFMPLVELINATRSKLDQSKERLKKLIDGLVTARSDRIKDRENRNSSILNLFDTVMKDEQARKDLAELGMEEKNGDIKEVGRIRGLDDVSIIISGMTEDEGGLA